LVAVVESLLGILDLEKVRSSNASAKLGNTFIRSQMSNSGEKLINATVNVETSREGDEILKLNLELGQVGRDVDLLENIGASVGGDNEGLGGIEALGFGTLAVRHAGENVEDETTEGVKLSVLLHDMGAGGSTNFGKTETSSLVHERVMGFDVSSSLNLGQRLLLS